MIKIFDYIDRLSNEPLKDSDKEQIKRFKDICSNHKPENTTTLRCLKSREPKSDICWEFKEEK